MGWSILRGLIVSGAVLLVPVIGYAQEATMAGTVTDTTGGVLPGVTIVAVHEASGNSFVAVSDERGAYRLAVRTGVFRLTATLPGFATIERSGLELLVGQQATVNFQMAPAGLQESVTVTGEAPLIDVTESSLGGNIDPRQVSELPINGRNWVDLSMLAPGSRANAVNETPLPRDPSANVGVQLNVDGQQITQIMASSFGQPRYSRDAIEEFEFISNRFDATQGRSSGVQVNVITKSGTNAFSGTLSGYFRDDRFNAADHVVNRVLPYSNQQVSVTFGGPIRKDRVHFFGNYEYEREPQTFTYNTPFPRFNLDLTGTRREHKAGARLDFQFSPQTRLTVRGNTWSHLVPYDSRNTGGATRTPSSAIGVDREMDQLFVSLAQVLSNRALNEVKAGYAGFHWEQFAYANWPDHPLASTGVTRGAPQILLRGLTIGQTHPLTPQFNGQETYQVRDDFTYSFAKAGRHDMKLGGEYLHNGSWLHVCNRCMGVLDALGGPIPTNIEDLFPNIMDVSTWNLAALSPISRKYTRAVGNFNILTSRHVYAVWIQDNWTVTPRLTLNLGLRYDLATGVWAEDLSGPPFLAADRSADADNLGPRLGFGFSLNDRTVIRGGFGTYFADVSDQPAIFATHYVQQVHGELLNDGRPDFASNPYNGPAPAFEQALRHPGLLRSGLNIPAPHMEVPYSYQTSIGVQRQMSDVTAVETDYVYTGSRAEIGNQDINLSYDPGSGVNYPFTDIRRRPYPDWGAVSMWFSERRSNYHALQAAFTKRLSQGWQASATYLLSGLWDEVPLPYSGLQQVAFPVARDLGGEYSLAATDQRHRAVFNGIWQPGYGFQLSGLYFYGSGERLETTYGADLRQTGAGGGRLRPNGTIVPRNDFVGNAIHRVDLRIQRRFPLVGRAAIDGIVEVFNLFNHANYGSYVTVEANRNYRQPTQNPNVAYLPRVLQMGFRMVF